MAKAVTRKAVKRPSRKKITVEDIKSQVISFSEMDSKEQVQAYFDDLKSKCVNVDLEELERSLKEIPSQIEKAEKIGQKFLAEKLKRHI